MANEITTSTLDDLTNTTLVEPVVIAALSEQPGIAIESCREFSLIGKPAVGMKIPTQTAFWGSANDRGAGVDTEFDGTQGTALSNTGVSSGSVTCTPSEYGVAHQLIDNVGEDSVLDGLELMNLFTGGMLLALNLALDDDFIANFANLSNSVGSTGVDATGANLNSAQQGLRTRGVVADRVQYVLDNQQASDVEANLSSTGTSMAVYALAADRILNWQPTPGNGMASNRVISYFRGIPVIASGLTDTANTGADVVGACYCPTSAFNDASGATTYGIVWKRMPRFETQRQAKARGTDLVMTMRVGTAELQDGSGTAIITDAP